MKIEGKGKYMLQVGDSQSNINHSLHNALQGLNCASMNHVENIIDNGHFRLVPFGRNMLLQWVNERNEVISISFPVILDLDGNFSCIPPNFMSCFSFFPFDKNYL